MLEVKRVEYSDLTPEEVDEASDNGCGAEGANYLKVIFNGKTVLVESDAMEPEDARFTRDLGWIKGAIESAYNLGVSSKTFDDGNQR